MHCFFFTGGGGAIHSRRGTHLRHTVAQKCAFSYLLWKVYTIGSLCLCRDEENAKYVVNMAHVPHQHFAAAYKVDAAAASVLYSELLSRR